MFGLEYQQWRTVAGSITNSKKSESFSKLEEEVFCFMYSFVKCHVSWVMCHLSCVTCHVSCVMCHVPHVKKLCVTRHLSLTPTVTATYPPPANSPTMHVKLVCKDKTKQKNKKHSKHKTCQIVQKKIQFSSQPALPLVPDGSLWIASYLGGLQKNLVY